MAGRVIFWRGTNRHGRNMMGQSVGVEDLCEWVKAKYDAGWSVLRVTIGEDEVGGIGRSLDDDKRVWWAEDWCSTKVEVTAP